MTDRERLLAVFRSAHQDSWCRLRKRISTGALVLLFLLSVQQLPPLEVRAKTLTTRSGTITRCLGCCDGECRCTGSCCADQHVEVELEPDPVLSRSVAWSRNRNCDGGFAPPPVSSVSKDLLSAASGELLRAPAGCRFDSMVHGFVRSPHSGTNVSPRGPPRPPRPFTQI